MAAPAFHPDPDRPGARIWRRGGGRAIVSFIVALVLGLLGLATGASGVWLLSESQDQSAFIVFALAAFALTLFLFPMAHLCWRHARGQWRAWIRLDGAAIHLHLPRDRSLIHRPPAIDARFAPGEIAAVEWRIEAYKAQGMTQLQRAIWLAPKSGERILLFEDRSLDTQYEDPSSMPLAEEIATWAGAPIDEKPMAEGKGGFFTGWRSRPPPLDAAEVTPERRLALSRGVAITRYGALAALALFLLAKLFS